MNLTSARTDLLELYRRMRLLRTFDLTLDELVDKGHVAPMMHLGIGQEAVGIGAASILTEGDITTATHRPHAQYVGLGLPLGRTLAEMMGRASGQGKGRGGHMLIADVDHGLVGPSGVIGHSLLLAVGHGYAQALRSNTRVTLCVTGDGSVNSGAFNEALNMMALWCLPVVVLLENNRYGLSTRLDHHVRETDLSLRAHGYGIPADRVDGNDVEAVRDTVGAAVERARSGAGPTLVEALTYRVSPFSGSDRGGYREPEESRGFTDPITLARGRLLERGVTTETIAEVDHGVTAEISEAVEFALRSARPDPAELVGLARHWDGGGAP